LILEAAILAILLVGLGLFIGLLISLFHGDVDKAIMYGMALLSGILGVWALVIAIVLAIVFACMGDYRKSLFAIGGYVLGVILFAIVAMMLVAAGFEEPTALLGV